MRLTLPLFLSLFFTAFLSAQAAFPADYLGKWSGDLRIYTAEGLKQEIPMQLHLLPIDDTTYTYTIFYGEDTIAGKRDYLLRAGSEGPHHWIVDEQDGIFLDNFYLGGTLHGPFSVMGSHLNATLELRGDELHYGITSGPAEAYRTSGADTVNEEGESEHIAVNSFGVKVYQVARLQLVKEK